MDTRPKLAQFSPEGFRLVRELDSYVGNSLDPMLRDLICLRSAMANGHARAVHRHSEDLATAGMSVMKICAVATWRETRLFTRVECIALELTEEIVKVGGGISEDLWNRARRVLHEQELGDLVIAIGTIALWNRLGIDAADFPAEVHC
jgi:AhpD family alkylhydroperoxidase